jgi:hypothetical protein
MFTKTKIKYFSKKIVLRSGVIGFLTAFQAPFGAWRAVWNIFLGAKNDSDKS